MRSGKDGYSYTTKIQWEKSRKIKTGGSHPPMRKIDTIPVLVLLLFLSLVTVLQTDIEPDYKNVSFQGRTVL
jgi:hypothetical protein